MDEVGLKWPTILRNVHGYKVCFQETLLPTYQAINVESVTDIPGDIIIH